MSGTNKYGISMDKETGEHEGEKSAKMKNKPYD